jgi:hypothetical protein
LRRETGWKKTPEDHGPAAITKALQGIVSVVHIDDTLVLIVT